MQTAIDTLFELAKGAIVLVPLVTGLVEVAKRAFKIGQRFMPLTAVILGLVAGLLFVEVSVIGGGVGVILGLAACGLWDFGKKTVAGQLSEDA